MADVANNLPRNILSRRGYPRSTSVFSPVSSRRDQFRSSYIDGSLQAQTSSSSPSHLARKRAASLNIEATKEIHVEHSATTSSTDTSTASAEEKVCLCQPDPKIPRPRNAFILYRQHYQAQVVALHPGLANPEISKIIGEQWTNQPEEVKNQWKRLAEEEKIRHQRQYPDYRYQPRRAGTTGHIRKHSSGESSLRCPKCNGRYILTPKTPSTPLTPALRAQYDRLLPPFASPGTPSRNMIIDDRVQFSAPPNHMPRTAPSHSQLRWRSGSHADVEMNSPRERRMSIEVDTSPEIKRRRFNNGSHSHYSPSYETPQYKSMRPPVSATGYHDGRSSQIPPGPLIHHQKGGMMEPPPRPSPAMHQFSNMSLNSPYDESLRLPPLQTQGNYFESLQGRMNGHQRADSQARSVEAMVMTIPYINKIKVLSKISPPLAPPGPTSPVQAIRGTVIAVEGGDHRLVADVGRFIQEYLSKEPECLVKTWNIEVENNENNSAAEVEMTGMDPSTASSTENSPYISYLSTIQSWHKRSSEIVNFITTQPTTLPSPSAAPNSPLISPLTSVYTSGKLSNSTNIAAPAPKTTKTTTPALISSRPRTVTEKSTATIPPQTSTTNNAQAPIPIALLPTGFSLSLSDANASIIPISDSYAPVDHWQWMATLWRGIIGPDLTIYVKVLAVSDDGIAIGRPSGPGSNGKGTGSAEEEMARFGGVECRWDVGAVIVRVLDKGDHGAHHRTNGHNNNISGPGTGTSTGTGMAGNQETTTIARVSPPPLMIEEKTLRRLGFEVLEWVRAKGVTGGIGLGNGAAAAAAAAGSIANVSGREVFGRVG